jgi:anti-sigma28 factor (negative regulator of flagellin synthesis)
MAKRVNSESQKERALPIARLREELAAGTYKVDTRKLAAKIIDAHRERQTETR